MAGEYKMFDNLPNHKKQEIINLIDKDFRKAKSIYDDYINQHDKSADSEYSEK